MIQVLWRKERTLYRTFHLKTGLHVFTRVANVDDWMSYWKLIILADVRIQAHNVKILNCFFLLYLMMETHVLGSIPIQCNSSFKGLCCTMGCVSNSGFCLTIFQASNSHSHCTFYLISCACYLLDSRHGTFIGLTGCLCFCFVITKRLTLTAMVETPQKFIDGFGFCALTVDTEIS